MTNSIITRTAALALCISSFWATPAVSADAIPGEELCNQAIQEIRFAGNRKTKPQYLARELTLREGDDCSIDEIIDSTQNIMDLGLFRSARAYLHEYERALILMFVVEEKYSFFAIPRLSRTSDAELRAGVQLRWDNFRGRLHQLRITSEIRQEDDGNGPGGFVHRMQYDVPRFLGSNHGLSFGLMGQRRQRDLEQNGFNYGRALTEKRQLDVVLSRWVNNSGSVKGLRYFFGFRLDDRELELQSGSLGPFTEGSDITLVVGAETRSVRQDLYRRRGSVTGATLRMASAGTGSDFSYTRADIYSRWYLPLKSGLRNLNVQGRLGLSDGAPFGEHHFNIGGGELLRGLESNSASGDLMALLNVEYLSAFYSYPQWRWLGFADLGNVYQRGQFNLLKQRLRVGLGLRWKIESISNTDIRLDIAWDADRQKAQTFVSSSLTF